MYIIYVYIYIYQDYKLASIYIICILYVKYTCTKISNIYKNMYIIYMYIYYVYYIYMSIYIYKHKILSNIFPQIGRKDTGR